MAQYKKMAGTSAVFVFAQGHDASPVERDGLVWSETELHLETLPTSFRDLPSMANALALEGLEDYDPPQHGDRRSVESLHGRFVYLEALKGWVEIAA